MGAEPVGKVSPDVAEGFCVALCLELLMPDISYREADGPLDVHLPLHVCLSARPQGALKISGSA